MKCPFCYIPFDRNDKFTADETIRVVQRISELGAHIITFGGGDPFSYSRFPDILQHSKSLGLYNHIDTNISGMTATKLRECAGAIDMIAVPIDGPPRLHDRMRAKVGHFAKVVASLYLLVKEIDRSHSKIKINTVLSGLNKDTLKFICQIINDFEADIWSIYQYWRLNNDAFRFDNYDISLDEYKAATGELLVHDRCSVELSEPSQRAYTYFFVSHSGIVYTHDPSDPNSYRMLGSIFNDQTIKKWQELGGQTLRQSARMRYDRRTTP